MLLLDEPTLGLGVPAARLVKERVRELARQGRTVVLTTHQLNVAQGFCHRVAICRILLPDGNALYAVMDALHRAGARVVGVNKRDPNLEEVFLHLTRGVAAGA